MNGELFPKGKHLTVTIKGRNKDESRSYEPTASTKSKTAISKMNPKMRTVSGLSRREVVKMQRLVTKLSILLVSNVLISIFCLAILFRELGWSGGCLDMLVSNLCLWLSYSFNTKLYQKLCHFCIKCSHIFGC